MNFSSKDILEYLAADGMIDLGSVQKEMHEKKKRETIAPYIDKIKQMQGKDARYYIHVYEDGKRKKIRDKTIDGLIDKIYDWHVTQQGGITDPGAITIADLWPQYVAHKMQTSWSRSTKLRNQCIWDATLSKCPIIHEPIADITLIDLEQCAYGIIKKEKLTRKAWKNINGIMKGIFWLAERKHIISSNPYNMLVIENSNVFRTPEAKSEDELVLTPEQEISLYTVCWQKYRNGSYPKNPLLPLAVIFAFQTGIRPSELLALKHGDIRSGVLHVSRYYSEKRNAVIDDHTKAGHGPRRIDLTTLAENIAQEAKNYKEGKSIDSDYIFVTDPEHMLSFYNRIRKTMPVLCRDADIPTETLYSARRTFVSSLLDSGANLETIKRYVGHMDIKTTLDHYNHDRSTRTEKKAKLEAVRPSISLDS